MVFPEYRPRRLRHTDLPRHDPRDPAGTGADDLSALCPARKGRARGGPLHARRFRLTVDQLAAEARDCLAPGRTFGAAVRSA